MIQLTKNLWLDSDDDNWIVGRRYKRKDTGKDSLSDQRYFLRLEHAFAYVLDQDLKNCESLEEIKENIVRFKKEFFEIKNTMP